MTVIRTSSLFTTASQRSTTRTLAHPHHHPHLHRLYSQTHAHPQPSWDNLTLLEKTNHRLRSVLYGALVLGGAGAVVGLTIAVASEHGSVQQAVFDDSLLTLNDSPAVAQLFPEKSFKAQPHLGGSRMQSKTVSITPINNSTFRINYYLLPSPSLISRLSSLLATSSSSTQTSLPVRVEIQFKSSHRETPYQQSLIDSLSSSLYSIFRPKPSFTYDFIRISPVNDQSLYYSSSSSLSQKTQHPPVYILDNRPVRKNQSSLRRRNKNQSDSSSDSSSSWWNRLVSDRLFQIFERSQR